MAESCYRISDNLLLPDDFEPRFTAYHTQIMLDNPDASNEEIESKLYDFVIDNIKVDGDY